MATENKNLSQYNKAELPNVAGSKFAIITSEWNNHITFNLRDGAKETLIDLGANPDDVTLYEVPGSFELIYGADKVVYTAAAARQKKRLTELGYGNLPICMAKNQYSLSDDPKKLGRPEGFDITIREIYVNAGAGFLVALTGDVMTMPGLPKKPAAEGIDVNDDGVITGLF